MARRNRRARKAMTFALLLWIVICAVVTAEAIYHALGWIIVTVIIAASSYYAGTRGALAQVRVSTRTRARKRVTANASYGRDPMPYRGGSLPREPVEAMDAVSAYPAESRDSMRARLLADPRSGVRKLFPGDDR